MGICSTRFSIVRRMEFNACIETLLNTKDALRPSNPKRTLQMSFPFAQ